MASVFSLKWQAGYLLTVEGGRAVMIMHLSKLSKHFRLVHVIMCKFCMKRNYK